MSPTEYLVASDFDQTLSFNDSGAVLSEMLGIPSFEQKVRGLASTYLVQQGAELAYLLRHDPEFRGVRREHLVAAGKQVRLKHNVDALAKVLAEGLGSHSFCFHVISASPVDIVRSALEGIVAPENISGTELQYTAESGEICAVQRVAAGYGKVVVLQELEVQRQASPERTIYIGDGSSDLYVMQHVNSRDGQTIAVSESKSIGRVAQRSVLSNNALSVLVPILEDVLRWGALQIREFFAAQGIVLQDWDKIRTDRLTFGDPPASV